MWRKIFSSTTTELSISREKASASPPRTIVLIELPPSESAMNAAERGERNREENRHGGAHAAEEDQDHQRREHQADAALVQQRLDRRLHEERLVEDDLGHQLPWARRAGARSASLMPSTTAMVLVSPPCFRTGR